MKTLITLSLLIATLLPNIMAQQVTFQSYMSTTKWAESVTLNGNLLNESSADVFDIPVADVLPGTNIIEFTSMPNNVNGVTSLDLVLIRRAMIDIAPLMAEGVIPADFDKSGYIGVNDLAMIASNILAISTDVENAFIHPSVDVASLDPFDFGTDVYKFEFQGEDLATTNFVFDVFIHGDVNMSALFAPEENEIEVRESNVNVVMDDMHLVEGLTYEIPFSMESEKNIEAFQFGASLEGVTINDIQLENFSQRLETNISDETLKMLMVSDEASDVVQGFISLTADRDGLLSEFISQEQSFNDEIVFDDLSTTGMEIEFRTVSSVGDLSVDEVVLSPNPTSENITISFPEITTATKLYISNAQGQLVTSKIVEGSFATIQRDELTTSGLYIVTIEQEGQKIQKKFIVL